MEGKTKSEIQHFFIGVRRRCKCHVWASQYFGFILGATIYFAYYYFTSGHTLAAIITILLGLAALLIPDIIKNKRKKMTEYAFSKNKIFFH